MNPFRFCKGENNHDSREHTPDFCSIVGEGHPLEQQVWISSDAANSQHAVGEYFSAPAVAALTGRAREARLFERLIFLTHWLIFLNRWTPKLFSEICNIPATQCCKSLYIKIVKKDTVSDLLGKNG